MSCCSSWPDRRRRLGATLAWALAIGLPGIAHAEVMDKEPAVGVVWAWGLVGGLLGAALCRVRPYLGVFSLPLPLLFFVSLFNELADPHVGPAMLNEAGVGYLTAAGVGAMLLLAGHVAGAWLWYRNEPTSRPSGRAGTWIAGLSVALGLLVASAMGAIAWDHNPQGEFHSEAGVEWLHLGSLCAAWFSVTGGVALLVFSSAGALVSRMRRKSKGQ